MSELRSVPFAFYNLAPAGDPHRDPDRVKLELNAIANNYQPDRRRKRPLLAYSEGIGRTLPRLTGCRLIQNRKTPSRKNVGLYVPKRYADLVGKVEWLDHTKSWKRPLHPGDHEPRSTLFVHLGDVLVGVGHAPQGPMEKFSREVNLTLAAARGEWVNLVSARLREERRFIFLSDPNGLNDDLRQRLGLAEKRAAGTPIEAVLVKGFSIEGERTPSVVNGVQLMSDHKRCLMGRAAR